jgi:leucine-rich repeat protein SHOC2
MGGTAALTHAHLADRTLAFGPRVDLRATHGAYLPQEAHSRCAEAIGGSLRRMRDASSRSRARGPGTAAVHVGAGNAVDCLQLGLVGGRDGVEAVEWDTFHHNVPMYLEREGQLVPLVKRELLGLLTS